MSWSLNEIEGLARKAARGSGFSWGLAEEAGKATRWLCAADLPGADLLAALLTRNDKVPYDTICPQEDTGTWKASGGQLCPLIAGAALCDRANDLANGKTIECGATSYPLLMVPFMAGAADLTGQTLTISWPGISISRSAEGTHYQIDERAQLTVEMAENVTVAQGVAAASKSHRRAYRGHISADIAEVLTKLAHRTYAPDTPESRLAGAGAGLTDND